MTGPTIAAMLPALRAAVEDIAFRLLRDAHRMGREIHGIGPDGGKWGIVIASGPKQGVWQNFATGEAGDIFAFIRAAGCDGDGHRAWQWARQYHRGEHGPSPAGTLRQVTRPPVDPESAAASVDGKAMFLGAAPMTWEGPVGRYLHGRGIDAIERPIGALRYCPLCWNDEARRRLPAMLAAVVHPITGEYLGTHRTWLEPHGRLGNQWRKARLPTPKKSLGKIRGGVIPLLAGGSSRSLPRSAAGTKIILGEGIENVLSVAQDLPEFRAAAYVSSSNLLNIDLPAAIEGVLLVRDRDGEKRGIITAREDAIACWQQEGRMVALWEPPEAFKDANDFVRTFQEDSQGETRP